LLYWNRAQQLISFSYRFKNGHFFRLKTSSIR
jgi:hypothetical protein